MDWAGVFSATVAPQVAVAVAGIVLAGILLLLDFPNRSNRVFALYLFLVNTVRLLRSLEEIGTAGEKAYLIRVGVYVALALTFTVLYFLLIYPRSRHAPMPTWAVLALCAAAATLLALRYGADHSTIRTGPLPVGLFTLPLHLLIDAAITWALTNDALRETHSEARASLLLVAMAFAVPVANSFMARLVSLVPDLSNGDTFQASIDGAAIIAGLIVFTAGIRAWTRLPATGPGRSLAILFAIILLVPPTFYLLWSAVAKTDMVAVVDLIDGILRSLTGLLQLILIGFALSRRRLFGIDLRRRLAGRAGMIAAMMLALFLVVTQLVEAVAEQQLGRYGVLIGAVAAGLVLFALTPLQRLADRLTRIGLPPPKPVDEMGAIERVQMFEDLARAAWIDGMVSRKEKQMLELARQKLGIPAETALRIESEASRA